MTDIAVYPVLANVDPVAVARATEGLNPATTMVIIISKTFTTVETMLNARTLRKWIVDVRTYRFLYYSWL